MYITIDNLNTVTAHETRPAAETDVITVTSKQELASATKTWATARLVAIWNCFAGAPPLSDLKPVKKFTDRKVAIARIWDAMNLLAGHANTNEKEAERAAASKAAAKAAKPAKVAKAAKAPQKTKARAAAPKRSTPATPAGTATTGREGSKLAAVLGLLHQPDGATLEQIAAATAWQKHTVRGFISTLASKHGHKVTSSRRASDKARVYAIAM